MKGMPFCLILFCFFIIQVCDAQSGNDLIKQNLKGKVKSLKEWEYQGSFKKGEIIAGQLYFVHTYEYNRDGWELVEKNYGEKDILYTDTFIYADGILKEKKQNNKSGLLEFRWIFDYDKGGNLIEENFDDPSDFKQSGKYIYKHTKDKQAEKFCFNHQGDLTLKNKYLYDRNNNIIESKLYTNKDSLLLFEIMRYNDNNNKIEDIGNINGKLEKYTYKYDIDGNQTEECNYKGDTIFEKKTFKYSDFDKIGNWLKKITFSHNVLMYIAIREIEYY